MKTRRLNMKARVVVSGIALALLGTPLAIQQISSISFIPPVYAAESHEGGHGGGGHQGGAGGHYGGGGSGHDSAAGHGGSKTLEENVLRGEEDEGEGGSGSGYEEGSRHDQGNYDSNKMQGGGSGAPGEDSDAKGPRFSGGQGDAEHGGKPAWAQEGVPSDVELGRLNVARSPSKVLDRSLAEALVTLSTSPDLYQLASLDDVIAAIKSGTLPDGTAIVRIDSPLENLALYKDLLQDGKVVLPDGTTFTTTLSTTDLAAIFLGGASDKTLEVTDQTVDAVGTILNVTVDDPAALADKADDVRAAIYEAHEGIE
ncbi:MAG TPA: hypothetical protein VKA76_00535 [Gammaproteobacteria bacterium]|nr:hypothetical protein [Gammaproteobacteria bacterium]